MNDFMRLFGLLMSFCIPQSTFWCILVHLVLKYNEGYSLLPEMYMDFCYDTKAVIIFAEWKQQQL